MISHELRTPITTIYGLARSSASAATTLDPDARDQAIVDIEAEADRLYRLVEDLLVLSRAEARPGRDRGGADQPRAGSCGASSRPRRDRQPDRRFAFARRRACP